MEGGDSVFVFFVSKSWKFLCFFWSYRQENSFSVFIVKQFFRPWKELIIREALSINPHPSTKEFSFVWQISISKICRICFEKLTKTINIGQIFFQSHVCGNEKKSKSASTSAFLDLFDWRQKWRVSSFFNWKKKERKQFADLFEKIIKWKFSIFNG